MKLIIQIPCYNEEETIARTLSALPRKVKGFDTVEWLVINDGSTDRSAIIAREKNADHIVSHACNQGLARAFMTGLDECIKLGADVIVNTDADNQYNAEDIPKLVAPILERRAEMVLGSRSIDTITHFSGAKKLLQKIGSWVVRVVSKTNIPDAPTGFRAISRSAASRLMVFNDYTYTLETIIQAGQKNMALCSVSIRTNKDARPSRLVKSIPTYIRRSLNTIIRIFVIYRPFFFFSVIGAILFGLGLIIGVRFLILYFGGNGSGHVQSLILAGAFLVMGFQTVLIAFVTDLLAANRKLLEDIRYKVSMHE